MDNCLSLRDILKIKLWKVPIIHPHHQKHRNWIILLAILSFGQIALADPENRPSGGQQSHQGERSAPVMVSSMTLGQENHTPIRPVEMPSPNPNDFYIGDVDHTLSEPRRREAERQWQQFVSNSNQLTHRMQQAISAPDNSLQTNPNQRREAIVSLDQQFNQLLISRPRQPSVPNNINPNRAPYPNSGLDQEELAGFLDALDQAAGNTFGLIEELKRVQEEISILEMTDDPNLRTSANYLRREIERNYVDGRGLLKNMPGVSLPEVPILMGQNTPEGMRIRSSLNESIAAESIIHQRCSAIAGQNLQTDCGAINQWVQDLNAAHFVADYLAASLKTTDYEKLFETIDRGRRFLRGYASGLLDGTIAALVAIPEMILHLPEITSGVYHALSHLPATWQAIKAFAAREYQRILTANDEELGHIAGEVTANALTTLFGPRAVARFAHTGSQIYQGMRQALLRGGVEAATEAGVTAGRIAPEAGVMVRQVAIDSPEAARRLLPNAGRDLGASGVVDSAGVGPSDIIQFERLRASLAVEEIEGSRAIGSALKEDVSHRSASYMLEMAAREGRTFTIRGGDGIQRTLLQVEGSLNAEEGIFEWITGPGNTLVHQRFIRGGRITGFPNQNPSRLPNHQ